MEAIEKLFKLDITSVIMGIFIIMTAIISIHKIIVEFSSIIGRPVSWVRQREEIKELAMKNAEQINTLMQKHEGDNQNLQSQVARIESKVNDLTLNVIDKEINDYRWRILDFAAELSDPNNTKVYTLEHFNQIFAIYSKYEAILEERHMENGLVETNMQFIRDKYRVLLANGSLR